MFEFSLQQLGLLSSLQRLDLLPLIGDMPLEKRIFYLDVRISWNQDRLIQPQSYVFLTFYLLLMKYSEIKKSSFSWDSDSFFEILSFIFLNSVGTGFFQFALMIANCDRMVRIFQGPFFTRLFHERKQFSWVDAQLIFAFILNEISKINHFT